MWAATVEAMSLRSVCLGLFTAWVTAACTGASGNPSDASSDASSQPDVGATDGGVDANPDGNLGAGVKKIVFASDFDTNGGCRDHGTGDQCDLYTAELTLSDGSVRRIKRETNTTTSESYPAWNPNGKVVYYTIYKDPKAKDLGSLDLTTGATATLLTNASWATVSPDGSTFLYNDVKTSLLMTAPITGGGLTLSAASPLTGVASQDDPDYSSDGRYLVFHQVISDAAVAQVFDTQTKKTTSWGQGSGHCGFAIDSLNTLCDNSSSGGILSRLYDTNGSFGPVSIFLADMKANVISAYDGEFAPCQGVSFNYPTFCGDDKHLIVSTSCNQNGEVTFSRLFLVDYSGASPIYRPLGKTLAESYKGKGKSSWTVSCLR